MCKPRMPACRSVAVEWGYGEDAAWHADALIEKPMDLLAQI
jgi:phosphoglycolate phosphatase-like HAD superfamily hydrolase